jgi:hypothetical protein
MYDELFEAPPLDNLDVDGLQLVDINIEGINEEAKADAVALIDNLSKFYYDADFMKRHPNFKKRVDSDLESLRILFKMRKADEEAHDLLIKAIAGNSGNASLYKSLADMQRTIISITSKINDIVDGLNNMMKCYQLEIDFNNTHENEDETEEPISDNKTFRGSKEFISMMNNTKNLFTKEEEAE